MTTLTSAAELGPIIRNAREAKGLSQRELADRCAVARSYITRIEHKSRNAPIAVLLVIFAELGLSLQVVTR